MRKAINFDIDTKKYDLSGYDITALITKMTITFNWLKYCVKQIIYHRNNH